MSTNPPTVAAAPAFSFNFEEAVRAMFRDPDWLKKIALGTLFSILGVFIIGLIIVQGYLLAYGERVARAEPRPLPEWEDFGELLRKGLLGTIVVIGYTLPLILIIVALTLLMFPLTFAAAASGASADAIGGIFTLALCGGMIALLPVMMLVYGLVPAAHAQLIMHSHDLGAAFRFREVFRLIRRHLGQYLLMLVISYVAIFGLSQVGQFACFVGVFATTFICQLFQYHLLGQLSWYERNGLAQQPIVP
jgi:hypothetical protein